MAALRVHRAAAACAPRGALSGLAPRVPTGAFWAPVAQVGAGLRWASLSPPDEAEAESTLTMLKRLAPQIGAGVAGTVVIYGVAKTVLVVTKGFLGVTFLDSLSLGFVGGVTASAILCGMALGWQNTLTIRPERVYRLALKTLQQHSDVKAVFGNQRVMGGELRAYTLRKGGVRWEQGKGGLAWQPPRVQMLFQVKGRDGAATAMVSLEASKRGRNDIEFDLLAVDMLAGGGGAQEQGPVLVAGSEERLKVQSQLRGLLQTERVKYIEQATPDDVGDEGDVAGER